MSVLSVATAVRSRGAMARSSCLASAAFSMARLGRCGTGISSLSSLSSGGLSVPTHSAAVTPSVFGSQRTARAAVQRRSQSFCASALGSSAMPYAATARAALRNALALPVHSSRRCFSSTETIVVKVPSMGDSITEGTINCWKKGEGDYVNQDELLAIIDTDKISVDIMAPAAGVLKAIKAQKDATVAVGEELYVIETGAVPEGKSQASSSSAADSAPSKETSPSNSESPTPNEAAPVAPTPAQSSGTTPPTHSKAPAAAAKPAAPSSGAEAKSTRPLAADTPLSTERKEERVPMSRLRIRVAERLKTAQNTAASLTTFNECDMGNLMAMRSELQDSFVKQHGYKFGFVSAFLLASAKALMKLPQINGYIAETGDAIIYKNYADISVAVATPTGLLVPVIRDCEKKSMPRLEADLASYAAKAREGKIALEDMAGGTFTISNGGVFGSLMGTPILNYPQSSILGLHSIKERPVARNGEIVIRPMMYLALTYDHRIVDGREAVTFLNLIKESIEDPRRLLLDI